MKIIRNLFILIFLSFLFLSCEKEKQSSDLRDVLVGEWRGKMYKNDSISIDSSNAYRAFTKGLKSDELIVKWSDSPSTIGDIYLTGNKYDGPVTYKYQEFHDDHLYSCNKTILTYCGEGRIIDGVLYENGTGVKRDYNGSSTFSWNTKLTKKQ